MYMYVQLGLVSVLVVVGYLVMLMAIVLFVLCTAIVSQYLAQCSSRMSPVAVPVLADCRRLLW